MSRCNFDDMWFVFRYAAEGAIAQAASLKRHDLEAFEKLLLSVAVCARAPLGVVKAKCQFASSSFQLTIQLIVEDRRCKNA